MLNDRSPVNFPSFRFYTDFPLKVLVQTRHRSHPQISLRLLQLNKEQNLLGQVMIRFVTCPISSIFETDVLICKEIVLISQLTLANTADFSDGQAFFQADATLQRTNANI
jgi:hypothetical protein